jgi:hypothetical protein
MTKTSLDVTTEALRTINVLAVDESASAADHARAKSHLEAIYAELDETDGAAMDWTIETVPDRLFLHLARAVAGSVSTAYEKAEYSGLYDSGMKGIRRGEFDNEYREPTRANFF